MVDLRQPPVAQREVPLPESTADEPRDARWTRWLPWLLVGFAVAFGAWLLRAELRDVLYPNDEGAHLGMVRLAEARIRGLHNPFDAWYPYLGLGVPQYSQYQSLPSIVTGLLSIPFGDAAFRVVDYGLLVTLPVPVFVGARLLDLDRWEAAAAALVSPMLVNVNGYGFEWGSFLWIGSGMWSMLWALWLLPIALGLAWRAVARGERVALAAFVVGLTCAFHFITGYFVLLSIGVFVLVRPPSALRRLGRGAIVGAGGLLVFSFVFVPTLRDLDSVNLDSITRGTFWVDSYGPGKVLGWLVRGEVFDYGRRPVVSLLVASGVVVCVVRARRHEHARVPLGLLVLGLLLWSGRRVVGPVIDRLPGGRDLLLHRFIIGVHFAGILLAGIGSVWLFRAAMRLGERRLHFDRARAVTVVVAGALAVLVLAPVLNDRAPVRRRRPAAHRRAGRRRPYVGRRRASADRDRPRSRRRPGLRGLVEQLGHHGAGRRGTALPTSRSARRRLDRLLPAHVVVDDRHRAVLRRHRSRAVRPVRRQVRGAAQRSTSRCAGADARRPAATTRSGRSRTRAATSKSSTRPSRCRRTAPTWPRPSCRI